MGRLRDMEYVLEKAPLKTINESFISRLAKVSKETDKLYEVVNNMLGDKNEEESLKEKIVLRKVEYRDAESSKNTTKVENKILDNILDNIKGLEDENMLLKEKLKYERERFKTVSEDQTTLNANLKNNICGKENENFQHTITDEGFHGFEDQEVLETLRKKLEFDSTVMKEEEYVRVLESVVKQ